MTVEDYIEQGVRALSIRQPWANAIIYGGKDVENRTWRTLHRGLVLIHAAKAWGAEERANQSFVRSLVGKGELGPQPILLGGVVGVAEIVDCVTKSESPWFDGPVGFVLNNPKPLDFYPCKGALGFFAITPDRKD